MGRKDERRERKDDQKLEWLRYGPSRLRDPNHIARYWELEWQVRDRRAVAFSAKHGRPAHDSLVRRISEHKQEVKQFRRPK